MKRLFIFELIVSGFRVWGSLLRLSGFAGHAKVQGLKVQGSLLRLSGFAGHAKVQVSGSALYYEPLDG
jgi:hypothetical protein